MSTSTSKAPLEHGVVVEFTRDSPLFRQQLSAYEQSASHFAEYCQSVLQSLANLNKAFNDLRTAQEQFSIAFRGSAEKEHGRSIFTNCLPNLGSLSDTLYKFSEITGSYNDILSKHTKDMEAKLSTIYSDLSSQNFQSERALKKDMETACAKYESLLAHCLQSNSRFESASVDDIVRARTDYELMRMDLVSRFNKQECSKKVKISEAVCLLHETYYNISKDMFECMSEGRDAWSALSVEVRNGYDILSDLDSQWEMQRCRLESEVQGALAPPGAPPGALSPVQPRSLPPSIPLFTTNLTTEILSMSTRIANFEDTRHARDDGVFKQGYLWSWGLLKRYRRWHRLFATKLYAVEVASNSTTCNMEVICDILGSNVHMKPGDIPNRFVIMNIDGKKIELQAENEDEMIKWICSLRRCSFGGMGRPVELSGIDANESLLVVRNGPSADLVRSFLLSNQSCTECGCQPIRWISTNIGVSLCELCASVHRQLTWEVSKVKNIRLDHFHASEISLALENLGNNVANGIWEHSVNKGWNKPTAASSLEDRHKWIMAKYYWFAFVEDVRTGNYDEIAEEFCAAMRAQNIIKMYWWIAHRANVNKLPRSFRTQFPQSSSICPLHEAVKSLNSSVCSILIQNGANIKMKDASGATPLDLAKARYEQEKSKDAKEIIMLIQRVIDGEY